MKETDKRTINAFKLWTWRSVLKIPRTARVTNDAIIDEIKEPNRLTATCEKRVLQLFGHIARDGDNRIEKTVLLGKIPNKRRKGRPPLRWIDTIKDRLGTIKRAILVAQDRTQWRCIITGHNSHTD